MKKQALLFFALVLSVSAFAQGVFIPPRVVTGTVNGITRPIAGATITVCAANAAGIPCAPALTNTVFKDAGLTVPLSNPFVADANGNYPQVALAGNTYTITESAAGFAGFSYQATVSCAPGGCNFTSNAGTVNGPLEAKSLQGVQYANLFGGTDVCQQINNASAALPGTGGTVFVKLLGTTNFCASGTTVSVPSGVHVVLDGGNISTNGSPGFVLGAGATQSGSLSGAGRDITTLTCTANSAKCVDFQSTVGTRSRHLTMHDLTITTTGTTSDAITLEDNLSDIEINQIEIRSPTGKCVKAVTGPGGGFLINFRMVRCDNPGDPTVGWMMDMSGGTGWPTVVFDNVYVASAVTLGIAVGNGRFTFNSSTVDHSPTGFQFGGQVVANNLDVETATTSGISIVEVGEIVLNTPTCVADAVCIQVNATGAHTTIVEPASSSMTGSTDITYSSVGNHVLIGGAGLQHPTPFISGGAQVYRITQGGNVTFNTSLVSSITAPTISTHFNTSGDSIVANGTVSFAITVGTGAATSTGAITLPTAATGWTCWLTNTNRADVIQQTASSTTSATFTNFGTTFAATNWTNSDVLRGGCTAN